MLQNLFHLPFFFFGVAVFLLLESPYLCTIHLRSRYSLTTSILGFNFILAFLFFPPSTISFSLCPADPRENSSTRGLYHASPSLFPGFSDLISHRLFLFLSVARDFFHSPIRELFGWTPLPAAAYPGSPKLVSAAHRSLGAAAVPVCCYYIILMVKAVESSPRRKHQVFVKSLQ